MSDPIDRSALPRTYLQAQQRGYATKDRTHKPRVREEGYFKNDGYPGSVTFKLTEQQTDTFIPGEEIARKAGFAYGPETPVNGPPTQIGPADHFVKSAYSYAFETQLYGYAGPTVFRTPITLESVRYLIAALQRVEHRMTHLDGPSAYRDSDYTHHENHQLARGARSTRNTDPVEIIDGCRREEVYGPTIITSTSSTTCISLGYNHVNPITGEVEKFEAHDEGSERATGSGSCGTGWSFWPDEIGKTISQCLAEQPNRPRPTQEDAARTPDPRRRLDLVVDGTGQVWGTYCNIDTGIHDDLFIVWNQGPVRREDNLDHFPYREDLGTTARVKHSHDFLVAAEAEGLDEDAAYDALGTLHCLRGPEEYPDPVQSAKDIVSGNLNLRSGRVKLKRADQGSQTTLADGATVRRAARRTEDDETHEAGEGDVGC